MNPAVLLLGFGEPETPAPGPVASFLERIFLRNARLDPSSDPDVVLRRARAMAERRAPDLIDDYRRIGGSPLNAQMQWQAERLAEVLAARRHPAMVAVAMQFTEPGIPGVVERLEGERVDRVVALPAYPLSGPSTTMAALEDLRRAVDELGWQVPIHEIAGWHTHPTYTTLLADGVRDFCAGQGIDLHDPDARLVFSAHGTPIRYLEDGSRYDLYVADHCRRVAGELGVERYVVGFQNHANRPDVAWTEPAVDDAIRGLDARRVVVVPVSFMQEQSETLAELDLGLRAKADGLGLGFHRVPVPHDDPRLIRLLGDLVLPLLGDDSHGSIPYRPCHCRRQPGAVCLNAERVRART